MIHLLYLYVLFFFFFNDTATTEIYTLSLHDALPILALMGDDHTAESSTVAHQSEFAFVDVMIPILNPAGVQEILDYGLDRKSTRLNSSHANISYAVFCLKKKKKQHQKLQRNKTNIHT